MVNREYLTIDKLNAYNIARACSKIVWEQTISWGYYYKKTVGDQVVRSIDSVGANIAEGFGRYHKLDKIKFYYYALGSNHEAIHWCKLIQERHMMIESDIQNLLDKLQQNIKEIRALIKFTKEKLQI